jgi:prevent-host-death family protein
MQLSQNIKPISYLKANAAKLAEELKANGAPYLITQNGEAAMVVLSVQEYEQTQETMAMLKMLTQSKKDIEEGNILSVDDAFSKLRKRRGLSGL